MRNITAVMDANALCFKVDDLRAQVTMMERHVRNMFLRHADTGAGGHYDEALLSTGAVLTELDELSARFHDALHELVKEVSA